MTNIALFEIGVEELPARLIENVEEQLHSKTSTWLKQERIPFDEIKIYSTPRRLAVQIVGIALEQETIEEEAKGPSIKIAKNEDGEWTKAALGFVKGQGKTVEDIYEKDIKGTTYIFVNKKIEGQRVEDILVHFKQIIEQLQFGKSMHWGTESIRFIRPIRWLVAMLNDRIIPIEIAHVTSSNVTYGHRFLGHTVTLKDASEYKESLLNEFVICERLERKKMIEKQIEELSTNFVVPVEPGLLEEVTNLVEYPQAFIGDFDTRFLELPKEVLITSMKEHQRYFPVESTKGELLAHFVGVRNGTNDHIETVIKGNEKVLRARLQDAEFFFEEDKKQSIDIFNEKLGKVVFQEKIGTYKEKVNRIQNLTEIISSKLQIDASERKEAYRAANICKFDLMTNMVNEFTELQGVIGEKYATYFGESDEIAKAIREHYLPLQANGDLPESIVGTIIAVADKLDTIVGSVATGLMPTGSQDPYGLRRQAIGVLRILEENKWDISLETLCELALEQVQAIENIQIDPETINHLIDFFQLRVRYVLKEAGIEVDIIEAVTKNEIGIVHYTVEKARILKQKRQDKEFKTVEEAFVRVLNLTKKNTNMTVDVTLFETESERDLYEKMEQILPEYTKLNEAHNGEDALQTLSKLAPFIHDFFENNMVMAKDEKIKTNRLGLLNQISTAIKSYADLLEIEWKQQF